MTREKEIQILMEDRCTKAEAVKHLNQGTAIYANVDEIIENMDGCGSLEDELEGRECTVEELKQMFLDGKMPDTGVVTLDGVTYVILYSL